MNFLRQYTDETAEEWKFEADFKGEERQLRFNSQLPLLFHQTFLLYIGWVIGGWYMANNRILSLTNAPNWIFLYTIVSVTPLDRYSMDEWNEAVSATARRRVFLPSYRSLLAYLKEKILEK